MNESELTGALNELKRDRARFDYVMARASCPSVESALRECGRSKTWLYSMPEAERLRLEEIANELHYNAKLRALQVLYDAVATAAAVKVMGLQSRNERIKQDAASEILDRVSGKAAQRLEHTGQDGGAIVIDWGEAKIDGDND